MHAEIVMIGTELLLGEIVDTNANRLALALRDIGLDLYYKTTVGDNLDRMTEVLNLALDRSDVIITSGGIGPTVDDVTRQAVADATGRKLVYSTELEAEIAARFSRFWSTDGGQQQASSLHPRRGNAADKSGGNSTVLSERRCEMDGGCIISLPGVPRELDHMMENTVIPLLIKRMGGIKVTRVRVLRTCAVGESNIDRGIGDLMTTGESYRRTGSAYRSDGRADHRKGGYGRGSGCARRWDGRKTSRTAGRRRLWCGKSNGGGGCR